MVYVSTQTKNYILTALGDSTDGIIRIYIYDDVSAQIGSEQIIAWGVATGGVMTMSTSSVVFSVPAGTVVSGAILAFYSGSMSTAITYAFEQQYTYNNAGTFTVTEITLSVETTA